jgi:hypothetical protein
VLETLLEILSTIEKNTDLEVELEDHLNLLQNAGFLYEDEVTRATE